MKLNCPTCKKEIEWSDAYPQRPFCCERCKLIDLGAWASESFVITGSPATPLDDADLPDDEPRLH